MPHIFKAIFAALTLPFFALASQADTWKDIPYRAIEGVNPQSLSLDIYAPENAQKAPILIMIHGGAWVLGNKANAIGAHQVDYFTGQGFVFVSINYRLAPEHPFPAHAEDAAAAVAYVHENIARYGGDPEKISLMGHSAGAHIAALLSTDPGFLNAEGLGPEDIHRTILLDGAAYDLPAAARRGRLPKLYRPAFGNDPADWEAASPVLQVRPDVDVPPMLIFNVKRRFGKEQPRLLHRALQEAGHSSQRVKAYDREHSSLNRQLGAPDDAYAPMITAFLLAD